MKKIKDWLYCDKFLFNIETRQFLDMSGYDSASIKKAFLRSREFESLQNNAVLPVTKKADFNKILALEVTDKCNYSCKYCFEGKSCENINFMKFDVACESIEKLPDKSKLRFFGGEPLLDFDLIMRLVEKYPQHEYSLVTNGSMMTKEIAAFLSEHNFSVGLSYDGKDWQRVNRPSLKGDSMEEFQVAMELLSQHKVNTGISTVVTKDSIPLLYDIHLEVFSEYHASSWAYLIAYSDDLTMNDLDCFRENLFSIIEDFPAEHLLKINDLNKWSMKVGGEWPIDGFCGAGISYSALTVRGEERICPFFLRESGYYIPAIRSIEVDCSKCYIWEYCKGGCLALNMFGSKDAHRSHPFACKKNHIYFEAGLKTRIKSQKERR
jgi:radical SAM protein with 4Fe4S-binding SPASM domain